MLKQEELAFIKVLSTMDFSPALFKELRSALAARGKKKRSVVPARIRSTIAGGVTTNSQRTSALPNGKRKAIKLACLDDSLEPAILLAQHHCRCSPWMTGANKPPPAASNSGPPRAE
jgi:hypothetical protein